MLSMKWHWGTGPVSPKRAQVDFAPPSHPDAGTLWGMSGRNPEIQPEISRWLTR